MSQIEQHPMEPGAGSIGLTERSDERDYYNARRVIAESSQMTYLLDRQLPWAQMRVESETISRVVGRFLITENQLSEGLQGSERFRSTIEAAVPVGEYEGQSLWMTMLAVNHPDRRPIVPVSAMVFETDQMSGEHETPVDRIRRLEQQGIRFVTTMEGVNLDAIHALWGPIFGWGYQDVVGLHNRLMQQRFVQPHERSVWFSAAVIGSTPVALAMDERLNMPLGNGETIALVESTEWCVDKAWRGHGLGPAVVAHGNAQVISDLAGLSRRPTILAETNYATGAHGVGYASGMRVPPRFIEGVFVPQTLTQNVGVGDGRSTAVRRDFTMLTLPQESIERFYQQEQWNELREVRI